MLGDWSCCSAITISHTLFPFILYGKFDMAFFVVISVSLTLIYINFSLPEISAHDFAVHNEFMTYSASLNAHLFAINRQIFVDQKYRNTIMHLFTKASLLNRKK